jgi:hypothetical protein
LHHTGSQDVTPVAVPEEPEEQPEEQEVPEADEEVGEDLPECPDHRPSSPKLGVATIVQNGGSKLSFWNK